MRDVQTLKQLLDELGSRYSIANLKLPAHGAVGLRLRDGSELYLEHAGERGELYAYTKLIPLPEDDNERLKLCLAMLELNFLGTGVEHGVLSIQRGAAVCHLSFVVAGLRFDAFDRSLQKLIAGRATLIDRLKREIRKDDGKTARTRHSSSILLAALRQGG
jgi:hypothetical protein